MNETTCDIIVTAVDVLAAAIYGEPVPACRINKLQAGDDCNLPIAELCRNIIGAELQTPAKA
jgi:hypothetical protein